MSEKTSYYPGAPLTMMGGITVSFKRDRLMIANPLNRGQRNRLLVIILVICSILLTIASGGPVSRRKGNYRHGRAYGDDRPGQEGLAGLSSGRYLVIRHRHFSHGRLDCTLSLKAKVHTGAPTRIACYRRLVWSAHAQHGKSDCREA